MGILRDLLAASARIRPFQVGLGLLQSTGLPRPPEFASNRLSQVNSPIEMASSVNEFW